MGKRLTGKWTWTFQTKLTLLVLCFVVLPFTTFGLVWYDKSTKVIEENAVAYSGEIVDNVNMRIDYYFSDIEKLTLPLLGNPLIQTFIQTNDNDPYVKFTLNNQLQSDIYPIITYGRSDIVAFSIITKRGQYFSGTPVGRSERSDEFRQIFEKEKTTGILGYNVLNSLPVITAYRKVIDKFTFQPEGIIVLDLAMDQILKSTEKIRLAGNGSFAIIDAEGRFLYHPDNERWGQPIPDNYLSGFLQTSTRVIEKTNGSIIIFQRSEQTGLTMVCEIELNSITDRLEHLRNWTLWIGLTLIAVGAGVILFFSYSMTDRLANLQRLMRKAEGGDLHVRAPEGRKDEVGSLYKGFNKMVSEIHMLMEVVHSAQLKEKEMIIREREAHLQAMQSRINPHFLYNTLEIINSYALEKGVRPISRMALSLAQIFRYSNSSAEQVVALAEELHHVETYLLIQKERHKDLEVVIVMDKVLLKQVQTLRLTLQPVVENTFIHGYEKHRLSPSLIHIIAEQGTQGITICISDRGGGMPKLLMDQYNNAFNNITEHQMVHDGIHSFQSIGLWNVHQRLRLMFGAPYGLSIQRSDKQGTEILMKLPYFSESKS
jgi:two-component system sensor histidine kinase YesM